MIAVGFKNFFKGGAFNIFDAVIVIASLIDIIMSNLLLTKSTSTSVITALRGFRLLRIFKLARSWKRLELLLETMGRTLRDIATFSILLFIVILVFTLIGLEIFAYKIKLNLKDDTVDLENGTSPDLNFDNFLISFTTVFVILTNDNTQYIYFTIYRTVGAV